MSNTLPTSYQKYIHTSRYAWFIEDKGRRETWEETGVQVSAGELAAEFDNGFRLYWCEAVSGREIEISRPIEIQHADWFAPELFQHLKWRYANQADIIQTLMIERQ